MKTRVAVVYGGRSGEHEISKRSANSVIAALQVSKRFEVLEYVISKDGRWSPGPILPEPGANPGIDVVFPILHGTFGEDGTIQGLFEMAALPYVGPGVFASSAAMDKDAMKRLLRERGLPVVESVILHAANQVSDDEAVETLGFPLFVKPANLGSSVGISKVGNCDELAAAIRLAAEFDHKVIVERGIIGREFECAVLGNEDARASFPCEIIPSKEFYDYEDKYLLDMARTVLPADLPPAKTEEMRALAVAAFHALQCEGMSRVDFLMEASSGKLYINELNTIPGFTSISMYPKMWEHSGMSMSALVERLIDLAIARHQSRQSLRYSL
ncbi:MAG: D-alanine--D-alanine ligase [Candidatus Solibacter usitatus]|nr:D-alanine--D-alanine ligase [Candidatus Solibacter usitatus]